MKHNNLKKPAAVLTALALAAALLAGCGAASDSMAASSAPAESEAVSTETPAESADEGDADEVAAKKCADQLHEELWEVSKGNLTDEEFQLFTESETLERELKKAYKELNIARQR